MCTQSADFVQRIYKASTNPSGLQPFLFLGFIFYSFAMYCDQAKLNGLEVIRNALKNDLEEVMFPVV